MRITTSVAVLLTGVGTTVAQPDVRSQGRPAPPQSSPALTPREQELLVQGTISDGELFGGVAVEAFVGYGIGQAVEGRWDETGWIFTIGESGATVALLAAAFDALQCNDFRANSTSSCPVATDLFVAGIVGFTVFRIWGVADAAIGPSRHNARVRELRIRTGSPPGGTYARLSPYLAPVHGADGGLAGVTLRF